MTTQSIPLLGATAIGRAPFGYFPPLAPTPPAPTPGAKADPTLSVVLDKLTGRTSTCGELLATASRGNVWSVLLQHYDLDRAIAGSGGGLVCSSFPVTAPLSVAVMRLPGTTGGVPALSASWADFTGAAVLLRADGDALAMVPPGRFRLRLTVATQAGPALALDRVLIVKMPTAC